MEPLRALESRLGEDIRGLIFGLNVTQTNRRVSLETFQQPVQGNPLGPVAMLQNWRTPLYDRRNDRVIIFHDQKFGTLG